jgi:methylmalonyl-CoA mutase
MFEEFSPQNSETWKSIIQKELKGKSFDETLVWESREGLRLQPFYHADTYQPFLPDSSFHRQWIPSAGYIMNDNNIDKLNNFLKNALKRGITTARIWLADAGLIPVMQKMDLPAGINCLKIVHVTNGTVQLTSRLSDENTSQESVIDTLTIFEAGASGLTELAWAYYQWLNNPAIQSITMGIGKNYYSEIAKFRAIRLLIGKPINLHAVTGLNYLTETDEHNNLLRNVTASMSAVIGGCDELTIHPYDSIIRSANPQSERWAYNIHHLLKHESHLDKIGDPVKGSYFLEYLIQELVERTREKVLVLQQSDDPNQMLNQMIESDFQTKKARLSEKKEVIINVNKHVSGTVQNGSKKTEFYASVYNDDRKIRYDEDLIAN